MFISVRDVQPLEESLYQLHLVSCVVFVALGLLNVDADEIKDSHLEIHDLLVFVVVLQTRQIIKAYFLKASFAVEDRFSELCSFLRVAIGAILVLLLLIVQEKKLPNLIAGYLNIVALKLISRGSFTS